MQALARLSERERDTLLAHEVSGQDTRSLADELGSTAGAVAAQLNRTRARLRVEYLLALDQAEPPTDRCRPVLLALSSGDRRRQREVDAARHLLECDLCARLSEPLMERGQARDDEIRIPIRPTPTSWPPARRRGSWRRGSGSRGTDLTLIATAVSEVARNIVRFAGSARSSSSCSRSRAGASVVARDTGPGIPDVEQALGTATAPTTGWARAPGRSRLMDEFAIVSEIGRGTTVTMTKWCGER